MKDGEDTEDKRKQELCPAKDLQLAGRGLVPHLSRLRVCVHRLMLAMLTLQVFVWGEVGGGEPNGAHHCFFSFILSFTF